MQLSWCAQARPIHLFSFWCLIPCAFSFLAFHCSRCTQCKNLPYTILANGETYWDSLSLVSGSVGGWAAEPLSGSLEMPTALSQILDTTPAHQGELVGVLEACLDTCTPTSSVKPCAVGLLLQSGQQGFCSPCCLLPMLPLTVYITISPMSNKLKNNGHVTLCETEETVTS